VEKPADLLFGNKEKQ